MTDLPPAASSGETTLSLPNPWHCFLGSAIASAIGIACYSLTKSIAQSFAAHPPQFTNPISLNLAIAVRTLIIGMTTLAMSVFGFAAVGLVALGLQILLKRLLKRSN